MGPDFAADVSEWVRRATNRVEEAFRGTAELALARVKELTPVRTGNLRANWSITTADASVAVGDGPQLSATLDARLGQTLVISNPTSYGPAIEYGRQIEKKDGTTTHTVGHFMLTRTVAELPQLAEKAAQQAADDR